MLSLFSSLSLLSSFITLSFFPLPFFIFCSQSSIVFFSSYPICLSSSILLYFVHRSSFSRIPPLSPPLFLLYLLPSLTSFPLHLSTPFSLSFPPLLPFTSSRLSLSPLFLPIFSVSFPPLFPLYLLSCLPHLFSSPSKSPLLCLLPSPLPSLPFPVCFPSFPSHLILFSTRFLNQRNIGTVQNIIPLSHPGPYLRP